MSRVGTPVLEHPPLERMMRRRALLRLLGGGLGLALGRGYLTADRAETAPAAGATIVGANLLIKSLDPGRGIEPYAEMVNHGTYDSLVTFDGEDLKTAKPSLAQNWRISDGGKTYAFTLRPNVRFVSGNVLTSADVKWSFDRIKRLKLLGTFLLDDVEEVQTPGPQTVVLRLRASNPAIIPILSSPSLGVLDSKLLVEKGDDPETYLNTHSAGTGPFVLGSYVPNQEVVLLKNPAHWRGPVDLDRIVIRSIIEPTSQQLQLERGDLDIALGIGPEQASALRNAQGVTVKTTLVATAFTLMMNTNPEIGGAFANPKVQQAVRYALDYAGILALAGPGSARLPGYIPITLPGALDPKEAVKTDRPRATSLLKEAGLSEVKGMLTFGSESVQGGVKISLLAQKIQADLAAVGITLDLNGLPGPVALQRYRDGKAQLSVSGWVADYPDGSDFLVYLPGGAAGKRAQWFPNSNPAAQQVASLGEEAISEPDPRKRITLMQQVQRKMLDVCPFVPLLQPALPYAYRSSVQGVMFNSVWAVDFARVKKG
jgi:peptide/nickel transport system substrate-binding protein